MGTPRYLLPHGPPLPYGGEEDLEKAIHLAMKARDTKAWKRLIQARTVRNNLTTAAQVRLVFAWGCESVSVVLAARIARSIGVSCEF